MYFLEFLIFFFILIILFSVVFLMTKKIKILQFEKNILDEKKIIVLRDDVLNIFNELKIYSEDF